MHVEQNCNRATACIALNPGICAGARYALAALSIWLPVPNGVVSVKFCKSLGHTKPIGRLPTSARAFVFPPEPPSRVVPGQDSAELARARSGEANPCRRAPFWHFHSGSTAA